MGSFLFWYLASFFVTLTAVTLSTLYVYRKDITLEGFVKLLFFSAIPLLNLAILLSVCSDTLESQQAKDWFSKPLLKANKDSELND